MCQEARSYPSDDSLKIFVVWGKQLRQWPWVQHITSRMTRPRLPDLQQKKYSFSDQKAAFNKFILDMLAMLRWKAICEGRRSWNQVRLTTAQDFFREGSTYGRRIFLASIILLFEIFLPLLWLSGFILAVLVRILLETGIRFPLLWLMQISILGSGINGAEALPPGENGYTKVYQGGHLVNVDHLEKELMERNNESSHDDAEANVHTICISYKHFANKHIIPGDDHRICRTDLHAIAQLIKAAGPCKLRFWIDTKLPVSNDSSFERWLNRGVRPYARYITFLCPSAQEYAQSSFWLSNEYHFASAAKGAMYFEGNEIIYDLRYGYALDLHLRYLQVLIEAERHPVQVRDEDKGKVIHWAVCCLRAEDRGLNFAFSPNIDNLTMAGEFSHAYCLMSNIGNVIRKYGPQDLPVRKGKSWNKHNPLLLAGLPDQDLDLSAWYGLSLDGCPTTVYFLYEELLPEIRCEAVLVLEVTLDQSHFNPGKIQVLRKVLRELSGSILLRCKLVATPRLCDWE